MTICLNCSVELKPKRLRHYWCGPCANRIASRHWIMDRNSRKIYEETKHENQKRAPAVSPNAVGLESAGEKDERR